jgi:tRNA dimethylallyltransferase
LSVVVLPLHPMLSKNKKLIVIVGPTASGKTEKAIEIANQYDADIFSSDSRQLYHELNIGVARPSLEELASVKHHFIASHSIHQPLVAGSYELEALSALSKYFKEKDVAILCGGTGLYVDAVINGLDAFPDVDEEVISKLEEEFTAEGLENLSNELLASDPITYNTIDIHNSRRVIRALSVIRQSGQPFSTFKLANKKERDFNTEVTYLNPDRALLYDRINKRVDYMIANGLIEEARELYPFQDLKPLQTVGYSEWFAHFEGKLTYEEALDKVKQNSRNYAKRQVTYFSKKIESWKI